MLCVARSPGLCLFREAAEVNAILGPRAVRYRAAVVNHITRVQRRLKEGSLTQAAVQSLQGSSTWSYLVRAGGSMRDAMPKWLTVLRRSCVRPRSRGQGRWRAPGGRGVAPGIEVPF